MNLWAQTESVEVSVEVSTILKVCLPFQELGCHPQSNSWTDEDLSGQSGSMHLCEGHGSHLFSMITLSTIDCTKGAYYKIDVSSLSIKNTWRAVKGYLL